MSYWDFLEAVAKGAVSSLVPGLHPMVFGKEDPHSLGVMYGVFTGLSIYLATKGIYHAETAGMAGVLLRNLALGLALGVILIPLVLVLYSFEVPRILLLPLLLMGAFAVARKAPLAFLLSSVLGIVALKLPNNVVFPLASGLFYLFGSLFLLSREVKDTSGDWKKGVGASLLTGYFPALPPSAWSAVVGGGDVAVAAALTPLFSLVALLYGKTRSAMTAYIDFPYPEVLLTVGLAYLLSLIATVALLEITGVRGLSLPREVGAGIMVGHAVLMGTPNVLLLVAAATAVLLSEKQPSAYFGFIITPTLLYYS